MIDNEVERANGDLRAMLSSMVNEPVMDAIRRDSESAARTLAEVMKRESGHVLRLTTEVVNATEEVREEVGRVSSRLAQLGPAVDSLKVDLTGARSESERALTDLLARFQEQLSALDGLPQRIRQALAEDFTEDRRIRGADAATLKTSIEALGGSSAASFLDLRLQLDVADSKRMAEKVEWLAVVRGLRLQILILAALSALEALGISALLYYVLRH